MVWLSFPLFALFCFLLFCLFVCFTRNKHATIDMTTTPGNRVGYFSHVTQLVISRRDSAIPSFSKVLCIMKLFLLMIYEINHIWTAEMKWEWRGDRRSERNLCNCVKKPEKISGLQRGLNPFPRDTGAMLYQLSYQASDVVHIWFISYIINTHLFHGNIWTNNWPAPNVSGFIAQLVEHRTGNREVTGSNPVEVLNFFQASLRNCINCDHLISSRDSR